MELIYPEVKLQIPTSTELPIADLERDSHFVILMQLLVETFSWMRLHLNVVGGGETQQPTRGCKNCNSKEQHLEMISVCLSGYDWKREQFLGVFQEFEMPVV